MTSPRHQTALEYAARGIPIFPCIVGGKFPATLHGFKDRTTDEAKINTWWSAADYNLAVVPEDIGCFVVDLDPKHGGIETWQALIREHPVPMTYSVATPSGGRHLYFRGSAPGSVGRLGAGIDVRGRGSYCLVPPSIIDGRGYSALA